MNWKEFINKIVDMGIDAAKRDYVRPGQMALLKGSVAGFEACRNADVEDLPAILEKARQNRETAYHKDIDDDVGEDIDAIWETKGFYNEVEWVCNVVSAAQYNQGMPTIITPTARGMMTAAKILGVKGQ